MHLARQTSLQPFVRCLPALSSADALASVVKEGAEGGLHVAGAAQSSLKPVWELLQQCIAEKRLVTIHFVTVFEYLAYLEAAAAVLTVRPAAPRSILSINCSDEFPSLLLWLDSEVQDRGVHVCRSLGAGSCSIWQQLCRTFMCRGQISPSTKFRAAVEP